MKTLQKVNAVQDDSYHWFVIPSEMVDDFYNELNNEEFVDSGEFDKKYGKYMTGGSLNLIQLYAEI